MKNAIAFLSARRGSLVTALRSPRAFRIASGALLVALVSVTAYLMTGKVEPAGAPVEIRLDDAAVLPEDAGTADPALETVATSEPETIDPIQTVPGGDTTDRRRAVTDARPGPPPPARRAAPPPPRLARTPEEWRQRRIDRETAIATYEELFERIARRP